jgi:O-antigen/teichoic acid export membrane protein
MFNAQSLGFFTRAKQFYDLPDRSVRSSSMTVFFPALSYMQDDNTRLISSYKKIISVYAYVLFPVYAMLIIIAKPLIVVILTDKWLESVILLQYFCLLAFSLPFESVNENVLYIKGRSDYVFYVTVLKKTGLAAFLFLLYKFGLKGMVWAFILEGYMGIFISVYFAKKVIKFSFLSQVVQVLPSVGLTMVASLIMLIGMSMTKTGIFQLLLVPTCGGIIYLAISYFIKRPELIEIIDMVTGMSRRLKKQDKMSN